MAWKSIVLVCLASWYSLEACQNRECKTADGTNLKEIEENKIPGAAMWGVPFGTRVEITNLRNLKTTVATINDRGPSRRLPNRCIDLTKSVFEEIGSLEEGLIPVIVEIKGK